MGGSASSSSPLSSFGCSRDSLELQASSRGLFGFACLLYRYRSLISGGSSCGAVRPPLWVGWVALLPHLLLFRALAAAVTVWSCRRPLVVFLVSPVSFLGTIRILNYGESYSCSLPRSLVKFSFRIPLWTWPSIVVIISQSPASMYMEDAFVYVSPLVYFICYCTIMFLCSLRLYTGLHCCCC